MKLSHRYKIISLAILFTYQAFFSTTAKSSSRKSTKRDFPEMVCWDDVDLGGGGGASGKSQSSKKQRVSTTKKKLCPCGKLASRGIGSVAKYLQKHGYTQINEKVCKACYTVLRRHFGLDSPRHLRCNYGKTPKYKCEVVLSTLGIGKLQATYAGAACLAPSKYKKNLDDELCPCGKPASKGIGSVAKCLQEHGYIQISTRVCRACYNKLRRHFGLESPRHLGCDYGKTPHAKCKLLLLSVATPAVNTSASGVAITSSIGDIDRALEEDGVDFEAIDFDDLEEAYL